jgi:cytochrome c556
MTRLKPIILATVIAACSGAAFADSHIDPAIAGAIKVRQAHMQLYQNSLAILGAMAQDKVPYDAEAASVAAADLLALTTLSQTGYWPQGSDNVSVPEGTRALPAIWETYPAILEKATALNTAATAMAAAAGTDLDSLKAAMGPLGGACGSCHETFRAKAN